MPVRDAGFPEKDQALRADVSMLGALVGAMLTEQRGPDLLALVECVRKAAIGRREGQGQAEQTLTKALDGLETDRATDLVRAFSTYFQVVNIAEKVHRIRRGRDYSRSGDGSQPGSLKAVLIDLAQSGVTETDCLALLEQFCLELVFTAHPTESTRRSLLEKEQAIVRLLVERLDPSRTPQEEATAVARIREAVTSAWQTQLHPEQRPSVTDEMEHVLFYISEVLYRVVPVFYEVLGEALAHGYGASATAASMRSGVMLRFGSWVGGDMDGNPNVDATTIRATLAEHRRLIVETYLPEVRGLARALSQSTTEVPVSEAVIHRCERYRGLLPGLAKSVRQRESNMPYRTLLRFMAARLTRTLSDGEGAYQSSAEFLTDIQHIRTSLKQHHGVHAGHFAIRRLWLRARTFGFHLAALDVRQDALVHRQAVAALLGDAGWLERAPAERTQRLQSLLDSPQKASTIPKLAEVQAVLQVFREIAAGRERYGNNAVGVFIVSMTQGADDVLSVLLLARAAGLVQEGTVPLDVVPLLETVDDLTAGRRILEELWTMPCYRKHLQGRDRRQLVMIGYSDSNKDSGIAAARWALHNAQRELLRLSQDHDVRIDFFHGRGGTVSRGGGNTVNGILAAPAGSVGGYLRVTEQGEVIHRKYGVRSIALRNLEQTAGAVLRATLQPARAEDEREDWRGMMDFIAESSRLAYRQLVYETSEFYAYFRQATPIDVIERMAMGSRPAARRGGQGIENLRAIPWVFAWGQTRVGLPGVYGFGTALRDAAQRYGKPALLEMASQSLFFGSLLSDVEMVLAKSDLEIGRHYAALAEPSCRDIYERIAGEISLARQWVLELKQIDALLARDATLQRSIMLRNPYVDPMSLLQVDLLRRWRQGKRKDDALLAALITTVNGVAQGIQNTG